VLLAACSGDEKQTSLADPDDEVKLGPYGPPLGALARVVRSVKVETSGEVSGAFSGFQADGDTGLMGLCNPNTFANFMLAMPGGEVYDEVWVTNYSKGAIGTGETGEFKLSYVEVTFRKTTANDFLQREFRGPGTITLTIHDADPNNRRMVGTMEGIGLEGRGDDEGKKLDLKASFDMDSSCGISE
jgi:hypothetical protein